MKSITKVLLIIFMITLLFTLCQGLVSAEGADVENEVVTDNSDTEQSNGIDVDFNANRFVFSLQFMWKGMLCIFIVIAVLIISVYVMNKVTTLALNKKSENE